MIRSVSIGGLTIYELTNVAKSAYLQACYYSSLLGGSTLSCTRDLFVQFYHSSRASERFHSASVSSGMR